MPQRNRHSLFVGSSTEGLPIARAIQLGLDYASEVTIWDQGPFGLSSGTLESLVRILDRFDYAVLVLTPDDLVDSRGTTSQAPRDNVLFELGLFMGGIGRDRTFIVHDRTAPIKLPSDLAGVTTATFAPHSDGNLQASVGVVTTKIASVMEQLGPRPRPSHQITTPRRVIGVPPTIMVTGGRNTPDMQACQAAAYEFGRLIAEREVRLLSGVAPGVDESFCRGVTETLTSRGLDAKRVLTCYTNKGRSPQHRFGKIVESQYRSREEGISELISECDIALTFGGGSNTYHIGVLVLLEERILLPVASSGGASSDLYSLALSRFDTIFAGRLEKHLFTDLADLNNSAVDVARVCVHAINALARTT